MAVLAVRVRDPHPESADFGPTLKYDLAAARRLCALSGHSWHGVRFLKPDTRVASIGTIGFLNPLSRRKFTIEKTRRYPTIHQDIASSDERPIRTH